MIRTVRVPGPVLDAFGGRVLQALADDAWRAGAHVLVLDLDDVSRIDSRGIAALVAQHRRRPPGTRVVLCRLCDAARDAVEATQLVRIFDVYESSEAVEFALTA